MYEKVRFEIGDCMITCLLVKQQASCCVQNAWRGESSGGRGEHWGAEATPQEDTCDGLSSRGDREDAKN